MQFQRSSGIALALFATALTVFGVAYAATNNESGAPAKDPLQLHGYPPKTASLLVTVTTGQSYSVTADVNVNFSASTAEAIIHFPLLFSVASVDLRLVGSHVYAAPADVSSGAWLTFPIKPPAFFGLSLEMTKPDIGFIKGFTHETTTTSGYSTTYDFSRKGVALRNVLGPSTNSVVLGSLNLSITEGSQGEFSAGIMTMKSAHAYTKITMQVLSYNQPVRIALPPAHDVKPVVGSTLPQLFASTSITSLLIPDNFTSLLEGTQQLS
jgi:hypothetical protein